ncbi:MAG: dimethylsulfoniopropionate demethylase [Paracoccaceae bacterium]|nr:dimethylsulfoniopropionate demethylase [Paracoccaceae bacterium]
MATITPSIRIRRTPFSPGVEKAGVKSYTVYNHTLLATEFDNYVEDYHHLKRDVQIWDVACEKQVRIQGFDAEKLMKLLSPRDLTKLHQDQCFYIPMIDKNGGMLNDPVAIKIGINEYWVSIADSDYLLYILGVADALKLNVTIDEPDISPLAVQGPKSEDLMARVFGNEVRSIKFFRYKKLLFEGRKMIVARSGYSKQSGFEIYVDGFEYGMPLWDKLMNAGRDLNVRAGCPNLIERIESGLLSYGNDVTREHTPFEAGLSKYVDSKEEFLGKLNLQKRSFNKIIRPIEIDGEIPSCDRHWPVFLNGKRTGIITSAVYSPDFNCNVAIGMVDIEKAPAGTQIEVETQNGFHKAQVNSQFWN